MSNREGNAVKRNGLVTILYRRADAPALSIVATGLPLLMNHISIRDYYCPFNTTVPLSEFGKLENVFDHLDSQAGKLVSGERPIIKAPRRIQAKDILLVVYRNPARSSVFFLLPPVRPDEWRQAAAACRRTDKIEFQPRIVGGRFSAALILAEVDGCDTIPQLIETIGPDEDNTTIP